MRGQGNLALLSSYMWDKKKGPPDAENVGRSAGAIQQRYASDYSKAKEACQVQIETENCILSESAKQCDENANCFHCGFNPAICQERKAAIRAKRNQKPPKTVRMANFDDVLTAVKERLEYAEKRLDEEARNGEELDVRYWAARRDGVRDVLDALEKWEATDDDV